MARTVPVREFRRHLSQLLSDVADRGDRVVVSRHGRPAAALVPVDEYEALEETAEILSDPDALADPLCLVEANGPKTVVVGPITTEMVAKSANLPCRPRLANV